MLNSASFRRYYNEKILEELFWNDDYLVKTNMMGNREYKEKLNSLSKAEDELLEGLNSEKKMLLDKLWESQSDLHSMERTQSFFDGFRLGMYLHHEAFCEK